MFISWLKTISSILALITLGGRGVYVYNVLGEMFYTKIISTQKSDVLAANHSPLPLPGLKDLLFSFISEKSVYFIGANSDNMTAELGETFTFPL